MGVLAQPQDLPFAMWTIANPMRWVGHDAMTDAADRLVRYMQSDSGRFFDIFAMEGDPNRFEWSDIVAELACQSTFQQR